MVSLFCISILLMYVKRIKLTRARSMRFLTPHSTGVKIAKIAIVPERGTQLFRPFGYMV